LRALRNRQAAAGLERAARALECPDKLERMKRIPCARLMHSKEKRPRKRDAEV